MSREEGRNVAQGEAVERAVVVEVRDASAILLTRSGAFVSRPAANLSVGDETLVEMTPVPAGSSARSWRFGLAGGLAAVLAVALVLAGMTPAYARTVAYTSVEINPAFTLGINASGRVTTVTAEDADATKVLADVNVVGDILPNAVSTLVRAAVKDGFVSKAGFTPVIVAAYGTGTSSVPASIRPIVAQAAQSAKNALAALAVTGTAQSVAVAPKVVAKAKKLGLSVGQYVVMAELQGNGKKVSDKQVRQGLGSTIEQSDSQTLFQDLTQALSNTPASPTSGNGGNGGGSTTKGGGPTVQIQVNVPSGIEGISSGDDGHGHGKGRGQDHNHGQDGQTDQGVSPQGADQGQSGSGDNQGKGHKSGSGDQQGDGQKSGSGDNQVPPPPGSGDQGSSGSGQNQSDFTSGQGSGSPASSVTWPVGEGDSSGFAGSSSTSFCDWLQSFGFSCSQVSGNGSGSTDGSSSFGGD